MAKCPVDGCEMEEKKIDVVDPVVLDACPKCDGIWMDKGELKRVTQDNLIEYRLNEKDEGRRLCPRCRKVMKRAELHDVILDECDCGIYFDKGEVDRVIGKRLVLKSKDDIHSVGVTESQLKELMRAGVLRVDVVELRLIREKDADAD
jgi:Zn-finger nucleic acid-binding protein